MYIIIHIVEEEKVIFHLRMHAAGRSACRIAEFDAAKIDPAAVVSPAPFPGIPFLTAKILRTTVDPARNCGPYQLSIRVEAEI
jgi:hypothetical protein